MTKFATPKYEIEEAENADVYPPSEDTFLFMDALEKEREQIIGLRPSITVEIGSGSGVITVFLRQLLATSSSAGNIFSICTDLNERALKCTRRTAELNSMESGCMELVRCNIMDPLISRLADTVDLLLLNPPYVPTEESAKNEEECCYAGGAQGRDLLNQLLPHVAKILSPKGLFYLVALKENGVDEMISSEISRKYGLKGSIVLERRCRNEYLHVLKFTRCNTENDGSGPSSTSCTSPATASKEEVPPSTSTQTQASSSTFTNDKVMILLKPVGEAKQLKKEYSRIKVDKNCTIFLLGQRIRRMLDMQATDSLYLFVKEAFAPSPDHTVKALQQCFGSDNGMLLIQYSTLPAWG